MIPSKSPRSFSFKPVTLAIAGAYFSAQSVGVVMAQNAAVLSLPTVTVTAQALGAGEAAVPSTVLTGAQLTVQKEATLGETLSRELGVSTTGFGANASRPVIRGLDANRIKLLNNGATSHDVSGLSFDHATPIDPLVVQRIEVLRGPATLLFGGGAVGGVINAIDNRIPSDRIDGLSGTVELRGDTAQRGGSASAVIETALTKDWMLHVDAFKRRSASTRVSVKLPCTINGAAVLEKRCVTPKHNPTAVRWGCLACGPMALLGYRWTLIAVTMAHLLKTKSPSI
jgi:iron complex outermembrane receptor protein